MVDMNSLLTEITTAEQLAPVAIPGKWTELIRGRLARLARL